MKLVARLKLQPSISQYQALRQTLERANRVSQSHFLCVSCGFAGLADAIAARNIAVLGRAAVNRPDAAVFTGKSQSRQLSLTTLRLA